MRAIIMKRTEEEVEAFLISGQIVEQSALLVDSALYLENRRYNMQKMTGKNAWDFCNKVNNPEVITSAVTMS